MEVDPEIVEHARSRYGPHFNAYDGTSIATPDDAFDLVVAFPMMVYLDDPPPRLREIRRMLAPAGVVLLTTRNRVYRLDEGQRPWNRYHVREYSTAEFAVVLGRRSQTSRFMASRRQSPSTRSPRLGPRGACARQLARLDPLGLR